MHPIIKQIQTEILHGLPVSASHIQKLPDLLPDCLLDLMALARLQASRLTPAPFTCGIINAKSGNCSEDCSFCAQAACHACAVPLYPRVSQADLQRRAEALVKAKASYMGIVTSGKAPLAADLDYFCAAVERMAKNTPIKFCASFGLLSRSQALALRQAGFTSYHHNLESSRSFFPLICSSHSYEERLASIENARSAGLRLCSGGIFGLGESWAQRLELAFSLKELAVDSIPLNFLTAIQGTPLEAQPPLRPYEALGLVALMRLVHSEADLVVCGGRKHVLGSWESHIFSAGANGLMTGAYLTTSGGAMDKDRAMMRNLGLLCSQSLALG